MMRKYFYLAIVILFFFSTCKPPSKKVHITLLQINDVYEIAPLEGGKSGGMARVQTLHKQLLEENPNTFLLHAGDFLNPSLIGTMQYHGEKIRGKQMIETMNAMGFDLVTFGNHEFDLHEKDLQKRLNESDFPWVSANVFHKIDSITGRFYREKDGKKILIPETYILKTPELPGQAPVKIGVVSVTLPVNQPDYVTYADIYESAEKAYNSLTSQTDFIIALTHLSKEQDKNLLKRLPGLKLIIGGHEHTNMLIPIGNSFIAKADANAKTAYIHRIIYDRNTGEISVQSELKPIDEQIVADPEADKIVAKWQVILNDRIKNVASHPDEIIYRATEPFDAREHVIRHEQTSFGNLIAAAMMHSTEADAAIINSGSIRIDDRLSGNITSIDIFRSLPYGGAVFTIDIKGDFLIKILNFGEDKKGKGAYLQRANLQKDKTTGKWMIGDQPIQDSNIYRIAITDFLLTGYDIPFLTHENSNVLKVHEPHPEETAFDIRKTVIEEMKSKNKTLSGE